MNKTKIEALRNELLQEADRLNRPTGQLGRIARKLTAILEEESTPEQAGSTPPNRWAKEGEADPHGTSYDCERASLTLGQYTDDELANGVFLNADQPMNIERILARDPNYHAPIAWLTAAKDRIRWLSRALVRAESAGGSLTPAQWADVYYFARASEIGEFLGRAEEVFNASLVEKRQ